MNLYVILVICVLTVAVFLCGYRYGAELHIEAVPCPIADSALPASAGTFGLRGELAPCSETADADVDAPEVQPIQTKTKATSPSARRSTGNGVFQCAQLSAGRVLPQISYLPLDQEQGVRDPSVPLYDPSHGGRVGNMKGEGPGGRTAIVSFPASLPPSSSSSGAHQCKTIVQQYASSCFAIVYANVDGTATAAAATGATGATGAVGNGAGARSGSPANANAPVQAKRQPLGLPVVRFDDSVDINGLVIDGTNDNIVDRAGVGTIEDQHSKGIGTLSMNKGRERPAGHFRRVPKDRGFLRVREKLAPFLENLAAIRQTLAAKLAWRGIKKGDDLVVMVVNEGETDLFLNFACSCRLHGISLRNVLVFAGSKEVVIMVEAAEAIGVYHAAFAEVAKKASTDYLDRVFVDMMWYKAFSTYLVLSSGINILFQDVDLVWFRDPFPYFRAFSANETQSTLSGGTLSGFPVEAFFSDDGQRSKRYSPYFFNSGFYYMQATPRSVYFTWSIMTAFDAVQVTGSHQNVFTLRLVESLGLGSAYTQILPLFEFPNGILYHHNKKYMERLAKQQEDPYHFHMCWTQGKPQKLEYMKKVQMWYLTPACSELPDLIAPRGAVYKELKTLDHGYKRKAAEWSSGAGDTETAAAKRIGEMCCVGTGLSKRELQAE